MTSVRTRVSVSGSVCADMIVLTLTPKAHCLSWLLYHNIIGVMIESDNAIANNVLQAVCVCVYVVIGKTRLWDTKI